MSAEDAIRAREAAKRPPPPEPPPKETHGRKAIEGDAGGQPPAGEPDEAATEATEDAEEVGPEWQSS